MIVTFEHLEFNNDGVGSIHVNILSLNEVDLNDIEAEKEEQKRKVEDIEWLK